MMRTLLPLLLLASVAAAQPLTLTEAVEAALASEPSLALARSQREGAEAAVDEAEAARRFQLSLTGSVFRHDEPMIVSPIHGFTPDEIPPFDRTLVQSQLGSTVLLWDGGTAKARIRQAGELSAAATHGEEAARQALILRTVATYLEVLTRAEALDAERQRTDSLASERARVGLLRTAGRAADVEVLRVEAAQAAAEASRVEAATALAIAEAELARLTALPRSRTSATSLVPVPAPDAASRDELERRALEANPALAQARRRIAAERAAVSAAGGSSKPQLQLAGNVLEFGSGSGDFTFEWNAGVQLRFSVFDGGATAARVRQAEARVRAAEADLALAEDRVRQSLDRALAERERAAATAASFATAVERFAEVARIERLRLENGAGIQTDYLRAESDLSSARASLAAARSRIILAEAEIARLSGTLDPPTVASIEE